MSKKVIFCSLLHMEYLILYAPPLELTLLS